MSEWCLAPLALTPLRLRFSTSRFFFLCLASSFLGKQPLCLYSPLHLDRRSLVQFCLTSAGAQRPYQILVPASFNPNTSQYTLPRWQAFQEHYTMAGSDSEDRSRTKRQKTLASETDPRSNPYLQHMYADQGNGASTEIFDMRKRHQTTVQEARDAEDGPLNPFTGKKLSEQYFRILKTRRNLPVQTQR